MRFASDYWLLNGALLETLAATALGLVLGYAALAQVAKSSHEDDIGVLRGESAYGTGRSLLGTSGAEWEQCSFEKDSGMGG